MSRQLWIALILSRTSQIVTKNKSACKHKRQKATKHPPRSSSAFSVSIMQFLSTTVKRYYHLLYTLPNKQDCFVINQTFIKGN